MSLRGLTAIVAACAAVFASPGSGLAQPGAPDTTQAVPFGQSPLGISDDGRDGVLYVPKSYRDDVPAPLIVMLHGFGGWADGLTSTFALAEEFGVVVIAPESREVTWGKASPGFDEDVRYIGAAYRTVTARVNIDPDHVALAGRSDGAGYALSMGLAYGDIFNHVMSFSGGLMTPIRRKGKPRVFIAHGTKDTQMPIELSGRRFAATLRDEGYDLTYREYDGGHGTPAEVSREAFVWFTGRKAP